VKDALYIAPGTVIATFSEKAPRSTRRPRDRWASDRRPNEDFFYEAPKAARSGVASRSLGEPSAWIISSCIYP
jgi:hypothetical protein